MFHSRVPACKIPLCGPLMLLLSESNPQEECRLCHEYLPKTAGDLLVHFMLNHLKNRVGVILCAACDNVNEFTREIDLVKHVETHHLDDGKWTRGRPPLGFRSHPALLLTDAVDPIPVTFAKLKASTNDLLHKEHRDLFLMANRDRAKDRALRVYQAGDRESFEPELPPWEEGQNVVRTWLVHQIIKSFKNLRDTLSAREWQSANEILGVVMEDITAEVLKEFWGATGAARFMGQRFRALAPANQPAEGAAAPDEGVEDLYGAPDTAESLDVEVSADCLLVLIRYLC